MPGYVHNTIKCVLLGDLGVGKTCLLTSFSEKRFPEGYISPIYGGHGETVMVGDVSYHLGVFDTFCSPQHDPLRPLSYPQTDVFLLCFSISLPSSFASVRDKYIHEVRHHCPGVPCIVVATQTDLRSDECRVRGRERESSGGAELITTAQGETMAWEVGAEGYAECSAKTREGVQEAFDKAMAAAVAYQSRSREPKPATLSESLSSGGRRSMSRSIVA
ncbi:cell division control protein 42 [Favolaschia claudopus]|uniref:Cell division control protein 42 n=1 Tax=Favolaschia claudopus TaxID=2862362 RepID=A0AAW0EEY7_9AGAR